MAWNDDNIATLRRMWLEEATATDIADTIGGGFSRNAVIAKAHRLGLPSRMNPTDWEGPWQVAYNAIIDDNATMVEAALVSGLSVDTVRRFWDQRVMRTHGGAPA